MTAATLCIFLWRAAGQWIESPTLTLSLVIIGEVVTLSIYLAARPASTSRVGFIPIVSTLVATFFFYVVILEPGIALAPLWLTASLQIVAVLWQIASKISLGRSFGLLPANRGIVTHGTYRVVRHPIYLGYFVGHMAFLLASFSSSNLYLFACLYFFQGLRIREEEKVLIQDPAYASYAERTRYRLIPGVI